MKKLFSTLLCVVILAAGCAKEEEENHAVTPPEPDPVEEELQAEASTSMTIDPSTTYQTIDGFGFFGAKDVWWEGNRENLYSDDWADLVINDLGITIWRNEYYPPSTPDTRQDADWEKQKPVVEGLAQKAKDNNVPLKMIFTVWSPPADLKCALDEDRNPISGTPHPHGTKQGGTLDPAYYEEFGNWLADGMQLYKDLGVDVYAVSPQNEPYFVQPYNSCFYKPQVWYGSMLKNAMPVLKERFPEVKIFGSENMLGIEGGEDREWFYHDNLMKDPEALAQLDIWAVHGYAEGITPTASSALKKLWETKRENHVEPTGKPIWMTETSNYSDSWNDDGNSAIDLAIDIHSALYHGTASAWVWWQGSQSDHDGYSLMQGTTNRGKKYFVSKHFYRFIRPGAKMVQLDYEVEDGVYASAYTHDEMDAFTMVLINSTDKVVEVNLSGADIPDTFDYYLTTSKFGDNCREKDPVAKDNILLPAFSVVTLVNGNVYE